MNFEQAVKSIPKGKISTYGLIAKAINSGPRAVGQMLKRSKGVPCHRVIKSDGSIGGYSGTQWKKKIKILEREGIKFKDKKIMDFEKHLFKP